MKYRHRKGKTQNQIQNSQEINPLASNKKLRICWTFREEVIYTFEMLGLKTDHLISKPIID